MPKKRRSLNPDLPLLLKAKGTWRCGYPGKGPQFIGEAYSWEEAYDTWYLVVKPSHLRPRKNQGAALTDRYLPSTATTSMDAMATLMTIAATKEAANKVQHAQRPIFHPGTAPEGNFFTAGHREP